MEENTPARNEEDKLKELLAYLESSKQRIPQDKYARFLQHIRADAELIAKDYLAIPPTERTGECCFVFMANERPDVVIDGLLDLKRRARVPDLLELILYTKLEEVPNDTNLRKIWIQRVDFYKGDNYPENHYMLRGRLPQATNLKAFRQVDKIRGKLLSKRTPFKIEIEEQYCDDIYVKLKGRYEITLDGKTAPYK